MPFFERLNPGARQRLEALANPLPEPTPTNDANVLAREVEEDRVASQIRQAAPDAPAAPVAITRAARRMDRVDQALGLGGAPPEEGFFDRAATSFKRGLEANDLDREAWLVSMGVGEWEALSKRYDEFEQRLAENPVEAQGFLEEMALGAASMSGPMLKGITEGGIIAGAAAALGQVGPQVLLPEEVITVPAAYAIGAGQFWYRSGAGSMYAQMRRRGIDHTIASSVAQGAGVPYAMIEGLQVGKIAPVRALLNRELAKTAERALTSASPSLIRALGTSGAKFAAETAQEGLEEAAQEMVDLSAQETATAINNVLMDPQVAHLAGKEWWGRVSEVFSPDTMGALALLLAPVHASNTVGRLKAARRLRKELDQIPPATREQLGLSDEQLDPEVKRLLDEAAAAAEGTAAQAGTKATQQVIQQGIKSISEATGRPESEIASQLRIESAPGAAPATEEGEGGVTTGKKAAEPSGASEEAELFQLPKELQGVEASQVLSEEELAQAKKGKVAAKPKLSAVDTNLKKLDAILDSDIGKKALDSPEDWHRFVAHLSGGGYTELEPARAIEIVNNPSIISEQIDRANQRQIDMAFEGLKFGDQTRQAYRDGQVEPKNTMKFFLWSILSRGQAVYPHESGAMLAALNDIDRFMETTIEQDGVIGKLGSELSEAELEDMGITDGILQPGQKREKGKKYALANKRYWPEYRAWVRETLGGTPGAAAISNLNSFGEEFMPAMARQAEAGPYQGQRPMDALHEMLGSSRSGPEVRREFQRMASNVGLDNKIVAFTLLVTGRKDLIVIDRVQAENLWDGKRLFEEGKVPTEVIYDGFTGSSTGLSDHLGSVQGLAHYEAMERALEEPVRQGMQAAMDSGRIPQLRDDEMLGAYHWLSWVIESSQEVGHGSIAGIDGVARGLPVEEAFEGVGVQSGKFDNLLLGTVYFYHKGELRFGQEKSNGEWVILSEEGQRAYYDELSAQKKAGETKLSTDKPWESKVIPGLTVGRAIPAGMRLKKPNSRKARDTDWMKEELTDAHHQNRDQILDQLSTVQEDPNLGTLGRRPTAAETRILERSSRLGGRAGEGGRDGEGAGSTGGGSAEASSRDARETLFQAQRLGPRGSISFVADQPAVIRLFKDADETTLIHELGHWFRRMLPEKEQQALAKWAGVGADGVWKREHEEKWAEAVESILFDNETDQPLGNARQRLRQWLRDLWNAIRGGDLEPSDTARRTLQRLLGGSQGLARVQAKARAGRGEAEASRTAATATGPGTSLLRASGLAPTKRHSLELPEETWRHYLQRKIQDGMNRVSQVQEHPDLAPGSPNLRLATDLYVGRASDRINEIERELVQNPKGDAFLQRLTKAGISVDEFGEFLYVRHAKERNAHIRSIDSDRDFGSGITDAEADQIMTGWPKGHKIYGFEKEFRRRVTRKTLSIQRQGGLISQDTFNELSKFYSAYVPLKGKAGKDSMPRLGRGFEVGGSGIRRARGRTSIADNPFVQSMVDLQQAVVRDEKNIVGRTFLDIVEKNPSSMWEAKKQRWIPRFDKDGNIEYLDPQVVRDPNVMAVMVDGKVTYVTINDQPLANAMVNLGAERGLRLFNVAHNYLRSVFTTLSPEFLLTNFQRDLQTALVHLSADESFRLAGRVSKDIPKSIRGIHRSASQRKESDPWAQLYAELKREGGKVGWVHVRTVEEEVKRLQKEVDGFSGKRTPATMARWAFDQAQRANEAVEMGVRLAAYKHIKENGATPAEAASVARELTVNFNRRGEDKFFSSLYLFFNASVQGTANIFRHVGVPGRPKTRANKVTQGILFGLTAASYLQSWANRLIDDDDWDDTADFVKDTNWLQAVPMGDKVFYLAARAPYGYNVPIVLGRVIEETVNGDLPVDEALKRVLVATVDAFSPLSTGSLAQFASPTILQPFIQWAENKNFFGGQIMPEQRRLEQVPDSQLYFDSVRQPTKVVTDWFNESTGGSELRSGAIDVSPETVDHFIDALVGGAGKFTANAVTSSTSLLLDGELPAIKNVPFLRTVVKEPSEQTPRRIVFNILRDSKKKPFPEDKQQRFYDALRRATERGAFERDESRKLRDRFRKNQREAERDLARSNRGE